MMQKELTDISEILLEITGGTEPVCSLKEIAFVMGVDYQTVWGYRAGNSEPRWRDVVRLSHHLIKEYGYYKLGLQPTMICAGGKSNGKVDDDLFELFEAGTDLHRAYPKDMTAYWNAFGRMEQQLADLKAEGEKQ